MSTARKMAAGLFSMLLFGGVTHAELARDEIGIAELSPATPHWVWVNDIAFFNMADGRSYLIDADTGTFKGMLSTGMMWIKFAMPSDYSMIYSPETYYSRHTRGERTDVLSFYDPKTLEAAGEVIIPPKRHSGVPNIGYTDMTDDNRFALVYNFNPAQSVSIVDVAERRFVTELSTAGCAMVYASGERQFIMMCGDGSLMEVTLDADGNEQSRERTEPFFDSVADPVMEKPVRSGDIWYFVSYAGVIHPVDVSGDEPSYLPSWSLTGADEKGWRPGGIQIMATHEQRGELFVLMHEGGMDTHKYPGTSIWVYEAKTGKRTRRIDLEHPLTGIVVTEDDNPILIGTHGEAPALEVYDVASGDHLRTINFMGQTPLYLQTVPVSGGD